MKERGDQTYENMVVTLENGLEHKVVGHVKTDRIGDRFEKLISILSRTVLDIEIPPEMKLDLKIGIFCRMADHLRWRHHSTGRGPQQPPHYIDSIQQGEYHEDCSNYAP